MRISRHRPCAPDMLRKRFSDGSEMVTNWVFWGKRQTRGEHARRDLIFKNACWSKTVPLWHGRHVRTTACGQRRQRSGTTARLAARAPGRAPGGGQRAGPELRDRPSPLKGGSRIGGIRQCWGKTEKEKNQTQKNRQGVGLGVSGV